MVCQNVLQKKERKADDMKVHTVCVFKVYSIYVCILGKYADCMYVYMHFYPLSLMFDDCTFLLDCWESKKVWSIKDGSFTKGGQLTSQKINGTNELQWFYRQDET